MYADPVVLLLLLANVDWLRIVNLSISSLIGESSGSRNVGEKEKAFKSYVSAFEKMTPESVPALCLETKNNNSNELTATSVFDVPGKRLSEGTKSCSPLLRTVREPSDYTCIRAKP